MRAGDQLFESHNANVAVDADSLLFLDGSRVDFVKEGFKETFKFDNPNVESECGCGESANLKAEAEKTIVKVSTSVTAEPPSAS